MTVIIHLFLTGLVMSGRQYSNFKSMIAKRGGYRKYRNILFQNVYEKGKNSGKMVFQVKVGGKVGKKREIKKSLTGSHESRQF